LTLGRSFGNLAEVYARVRPAYPEAALDRAQEALALDRDAHVVDLAAGTGRLTEALVPRFESVFAVEPDDAMRALIRHDRVLAGTAEAIPLTDGTADAVFVGEAFHWFDWPLALREIARVLRPGGGLVLISNDWWETEPPIPERAQTLLRDVFVRSGRASQVANPSQHLDWSPFEEPRDEAFAWERAVQAETLLELYSTTSSLAALSPGERAVLLSKLRPLLEPVYRLPIRTELVWTRLA
jgi:ubiquinone/menaquinone biosynthesis C-methylase UbiE